MKNFFAAAIVLCAALSARAFENVCTHPQLTGRGLSLIETLENRKSQELREFQSQIFDWVEKEDVDPNFVVVYNHFYNPRNGSKLNVAGLPSRLLLAETESAAVRADRFFGNALDAYKAGNKNEAYKNLGRAVHLIQDMHQPAHVHNDSHIPKVESGALVVLQALVAAIPGLGGLGGIDGSPLENAVEEECKAQGGVGANIPNGVAFANGENRFNINPAGLRESDFALFLSAAEKTYRASAFPVDLPAPTTGHFTAVSVFNGLIEIEFMEPVAKSANPCMRKLHWLLKTGGDGLCYDPLIPYDGNVLQKFTNDWWEVLPDITYPDAPPPLIPERRIYIEKYDQVTSGGGLTLNERFIYAQLPAAVEMTATYIRLFKNLADKKAPELAEFREGSSVGAPLSPGGASSVDSIYLQVRDNTDALILSTHVAT